MQDSIFVFVEKSFDEAWKILKKNGLLKGIPKRYGQERPGLVALHLENLYRNGKLSQVEIETIQNSNYGKDH